MTKGELPTKIAAGTPVTVADLVVHSSDRYVVYDLLYSLAGTSFDASFAGFPRWRISSFGGSPSMEEYDSSHGGVSKGEGEGPGDIGVYMIQSLLENGGKKVHEIVFAEGK